MFNEKKNKLGLKQVESLSSLRVLGAEACEVLIRIASLAAIALGKDREGTEMRIRGATLCSWRRRVRVGRQVRFVGPASQVTIGADVSLHGNAYLNANGPKGAISVGDGSHFDQFCVLHGQGGLTIGRDCAISSGVLIYSQTNHDFLHDGTSVTKQPTRYAPVNIGNACWIGAGAIILPGVTVGDGARIGAGAVVLNDVPPSTTVAGVPARPLVQES